ncbi:galactose-1-phosphate uridylyltransferase [Limnochorda pilosa]|uniref:Galactose-1-phosphate uridylyltransferase n=1 Tax=Limnochorda pilosa TaxID=1555112 RepID=A0A0K2SIU1_LIMPI|nr:galactose-1-phosphate uridylyltransferase [Limnochorda pilosa]BAS27046.1 galactose-1-phosphate uridylyltransferase [Limnochorda pilosa]
MSELRWHPLLEQWVITATHRQDRTYKPPADHCPLCPTRPGGEPTEIPAARYQIAVFENRFPSLVTPAPQPAVQATELSPVEPAAGRCEVVCYTPEHEGSLATLPPEHAFRLVQVWTDRYRTLMSQPGVRYVLIFENRGEVVGVTLHHPHGQVYAFPYVPPVPLRELEAQARFQGERAEGPESCLLCRQLALEHQDGRRVLAENEGFTAVIPFYARYPYEVHVIARRHRASLAELSEAEQRDLAAILQGVVGTYDRLYGFPFPYVMVMHQAPKPPAPASGHFHVEFYPPHRTREKLKYLAGCEQGAGSFINDTLPEEKAAELRRCWTWGPARGAGAQGLR